ncbi:MAG: type II toxin-antitoxin system RelE/ParE family toxin [Desulfovibrionaceae bacterium]|nr:type II toxin-antitoxin system RelE/ParE family toxin [Desulfovibrionaceae bacterium]
MKRVLKSRTFSRWQRKANLPDDILCAAVDEMERGLIDANLGGGLFKKRVPFPGRGKRGSSRTILATNLSTRWFFIFGFEKNDRENITQQELAFLQSYADKLLHFSDNELNYLITHGEMEEICNAQNEPHH